MNFHVMTIFPEIIKNACNYSILRRAQDNNFISINVTNIRDFSDNKHKKVDDYPFGGGAGMVMTYKPIINCYNNIISNIPNKDKLRTIYLSPSGKVFNQSDVLRLQEYENIALLCGHYEGVDQRVIDTIIDEEISIGDYILTGGEIPAIVLIESISRLIDGVLSNKDSYTYESFHQNLLEHPQYTRPSIIDDIKVPQVLLNGNHKEINDWRLEKSLEKTLKNRPDLFKKFSFDDFDDKEKKILKKILNKLNNDDILL